MAKFKVGDRVRVIDGRGAERAVVGQCGEVTRIGVTTLLEVRMDCGPSPCDADWLWWPHELAPLTPPAEDTWAADKVKQVTKPQHVEPVRQDGLRIREPNIYTLRNLERGTGSCRNGNTARSTTTRP